MLARHKHQKGIALITAMIVTFVAVAIATDLGTQQQRQLHRAEALHDSNKALSILHDTEQLAAAKIIKDLRASRANYIEAIPVDLAALVDSNRIKAEISDLQQKFNLNDLYRSGQVRAVALQRLRLLLEALRQDPHLTNTILDWIDNDGQRRDPGGAEDARYSRGTNAYRAANRHFTNVRELLLLHGVTLEIYEIIAAHTVTLPPGSGININTADPQVLRVIAPEMTGVQLKNLLHQRKTEPFSSPKDFLAMPGVAESEAVLDGLTTQSRYFSLATAILLGDRTYRFTSHIESDGVRARVIARFPEES